VLENLEISFPWGRTVWGSLTFNRTPEISDKIHKVAEEIYLSVHD
jgi:urea transport system ATP-binding protein